VHTWDSILDQEKIKHFFQTAFKNKSIAQAYCFIGDDGYGKDAIALTLAALVNCSSPRITQTSADPCGVCKSCLAASEMANPNIHFLFPLPAVKATSDIGASPISLLTEQQFEEVSSELQKKKNDPYYEITMSGSDSHLINTIRFIIRESSLSLHNDGKKCFIISRAHRLNTESANALLKTLEEPNPNTVFILTTSQPDFLPKTILSRTQVIHFEPIKQESVQHYLMQRYQLSQENALLFSKISDGSISKALSLFSEDIQQYRELVVELLRTILRGGAYRNKTRALLSELIDSKNKKQTLTFLQLLLLWLRDAFTASVSISNSTIVNVDQMEAIQRFGTHYKSANFSAAFTAIERAKRQIEGNGNIQLVLLALCLKIRESIKT
jgi:DNA polymerase-3 subunit delta'